MRTFGTHTRFFGIKMVLASTLIATLLGFSALLATPALAFDSVTPRDFEGYPGIPIYRLWDPEDGEFIYTASDEECVALQYDDEWVYDGIAFYTAAEGDPVYRLTEVVSGTPAWTTDFDEYTSRQSEGWLGEGIAWYSSGDQPVYELYDAQTSIHCYTTSQRVLETLGSSAPWQYEQVAFTVEAAGTEAAPKAVGALGLSAQSVSLNMGANTTIKAAHATPGTLSACSDDDSVALARVEGSSVVIEPQGIGTTVVSVQRSAKGFYPAEIGKVEVSVAAGDVANVEVWRLYNPYSHEHLFTTKTAEYDDLGALGWQQEGLAWVAPGVSTKPVYRLFNPYNHDHFYTTSLTEYEQLKVAGWDGEGEYWYSDDAQNVPVYRVFNPYIQGAGAHQFTADSAEYLALLDAGWTDEGIGWHAIEKGQPIAPPQPDNPGGSGDPNNNQPGGSDQPGGSGGGQTGGNESQPGGGSTTPSNPSAEPFYRINTKTKKIHGDNCSTLHSANFNASYWKTVSTPEEAKNYLNMGYEKCKVCKPTGI